VQGASRSLGVQAAEREPVGECDLRDGGVVDGHELHRGAGVGAADLVGGLLLLELAAGKPPRERVKP